MSMKMAKASEADLKMAMNLCSALDALTGRWGATMPEAIQQPDGTSDTEYFDADDSEQCKRVVAYPMRVGGERFTYAGCVGDGRSARSEQRNREPGR